MTQPWNPRRLTAVTADLPPGVTPPGTRGRILHAALKLFAEYGFFGTSIRDIARDVGINPATLYAHFPAKEHVLAELIRLGHEELRRRMREAAADRPRKPGTIGTPVEGVETDVWTAEGEPAPPARWARSSSAGTT